nr:exosome component 10 [Leptinotarsa decemlineata]
MTEEIETEKDCQSKSYSIPGHENLDVFIKGGFKILVEAIKNSNSLPQGSNWNFYNTHDSFVKIINEESKNILKAANTILHTNHVEGNIRNRGSEEKNELLIEANDMILERVANNIDEMNGIKKSIVEPVLIQTVSAQLPINGSWNRASNATFSVGSSITTEENANKPSNAIRLLTAKNIIRPQTFFKDKIINSNKYPWEPRLKEKPNSLKPLAIFLEETEHGEEFSHPYEFELERFTPLPEQLLKETPAVPLPLEKTPLIEVTQPEQVNELVETLRNCKEFAVDLEHHSYRTFMGITCLMQISTRDTDYIIDTLALRDKLHVLNEVFTKPTIVKIFHGADSDIKWLQRDLSLYVVNMFDTYQASKQLGYSGLSLAYLMQKFCNFVPNKQFQLADWRIRPLPEQLKSYAREDTHYLIYIYHKLKNELLETANGFDNLLVSVINKSTEVCKQRYLKPILREDSHLDFYRKCKRLFDNRQLYALKELYKWRDVISREEDESTGYVLPNHMLLQISESLPREMQGILACCNPIPPLVRSNLLELHQIILKAREQPLEKPILKEDTRARGTTKKISKINVDSPLHCPHDLTKTNDFRDDLPTLLGNLELKKFHECVNDELALERCTPTFSVFDGDKIQVEDANDTRKKLQSFKFLTPFERYKLVKPFIQEEEEKLAAAEKDKETEEQPPNSGITSKEEGFLQTDEERIESIREHFLKLSKMAPSIIPIENLDKSLVQMGGTKKRKRDSSLPEDQETAEDNIFTPAPTPTVVNNNNARKRKSNDRDGSNTPKKKKNRKNFWRQKSEDNLRRQDITQHAQNNDRLRDYPHSSETVDNYNSCTNRVNENDNIPGKEKKRNKKKKRNNQTDRGHGYLNRGGQNSWNGQSRPGEQQSQDFPGQQSQDFPGQQSQDFSGRDDNFAGFDYSSVDFNQFQGGAGNANRPKGLNSNFKSRGRKRGGSKGHNRSTTFRSINKSLGRGRGRGR